jgi:hypothetical protein
MRRVSGLLAALVLTACQDTPLAFRADGAGPTLAISDGAHGGNPFVFFLPPLVPQPSFEGTFAPDADPTVAICTLVDGACGTVVTTFGGDDIKIAGEAFLAHWQTGERNGISSDQDYRIEIRAGELVLAFRDVDPKASPREVPDHPEVDDLYAFQNGRTIPIKFRLEEGFLCAALSFDDESGQCNEGNLRDGLMVQIPESGTGVSVPPQDLDLPVAIVVEPCPAGQGLPVDLPTYGGCFEVRTSTPLTQPLNPLAAVFVCEEPPGLDERQQGLVRLHKSDALDGSTAVFALPNAPGLCPFEQARGPAGGSLWARALRSVGRGLARLTGPQPLHAALLDRGAAGLTGGFSFFQLAMPAKMVVHVGDGQEAEPGAPVPIDPLVFVTDFDGFPVDGATVRFDVILGGGMVTPGAVTTGTDGRAQVSWILGVAGLNGLRASGRGIADPITNGPLPGFDPFKPIPQPNPADEIPAQLFTGELHFSAAAVSRR